MPELGAADDTPTLKVEDELPNLESFHVDLAKGRERRVRLPLPVAHQ